METRVCRICSQGFPATNEFFYKKSSGKFGLRSECKVCAKKIPSWKKLNPEKTKLAQAKWNMENPEKIKNYQKVWISKNREKVNGFAQKWRENNPDKANFIKKKDYIHSRDNLTDRYIANLLKKNASEIDPDVIETRRLTILLKRELGFGTGIREQNKLVS